MAERESDSTPAVKEQFNLIPLEKLERFNPQERAVLQMLAFFKIQGGTVMRLIGSINNADARPSADQMKLMEMLRKLEPTGYKSLKELTELLGIPEVRVNELHTWLLRNEMNF